MPDRMMVFERWFRRNFTDIYVMDLGSDVRRNPKISGTTHNVFGIQTGVAVAFLVREKSRLGECSIHYARREDAELARDKLDYLKETTLEHIPFESITADTKNNWLNLSNTNFERLMPLANRETKASKGPDEQVAVFKLYSIGTDTHRDEWVYDFNRPVLLRKANLFADRYNELMDKNAEPNDPSIKWSEAVRNRFLSRRRIVYDDIKCVESLYRPFVAKHYYAEPIMTDRLTVNHFEMFRGRRATNQPSNLLLCER